MLPFPHSNFAKNFEYPSVMEAITRLGLATNLKLCLDFGVSACYSSGQNITDLSGTSRNFIRGNTTGSASDDPTFAGTAGGRSASEYFTGDGFQFLKDNSGQAALNFHRDNAIFTVLVVWWRGSASASDICGNASSGDSYRGWRISDDLGTLVFGYGNTGGSVNTLSDVSPGTVHSTWQIGFMAYNEGSANGHWRVNGNTTTISNGLSSPATSNTTTPFTALGAPNSAASNLSRLAAIAIWNGTALSAAETLAIFQAIGGRWGL